MRKLSKKLTIVSLVVLPAILGGCFLAPQGQNTNTNVILNPPKADEESGEIDTSDWKTYRNEEYGFEFRYPGEWRIEEKNNSVLFWRDTDKDSQVSNESGAPLIVSIKEVSFNSIKDWFDAEFYDRSNDFMPNYNEIIIGGVPALEILDPLTMGGCDQTFTVIKYFRLYEIKRHGSTCNYLNELFNQILESFKFIN